MLGNDAWTGGLTLHAQGGVADIHGVYTPLTLTTGVISDLYTDTLYNDGTHTTTWTQTNLQSFCFWYSTILPPLYPIRTLMTLINTATTTDPNFISGAPRVDLWIWLQGASGSMIYKQVTAGNMVYDLRNNVKSNAPVPFAFLVSNYYQPTFNLDKLIAMREYSLNPVIIPTARLRYRDYDIGGTSGQSQIIPPTDPMFASFFSDDLSKCPRHSNYFGDGGPVEMQQFLGNLNNGEPQALISSVFLQMGPLNVDAFTWKIQLKDWITDPNSPLWLGTPSWGGALAGVDIPVTGTTGNFMHDFTTDSNPLVNSQPVPIGPSYIKYPATTANGQQICTLQFFGWYFCQADSFTAAQYVNLFDSKSFVIGFLKAYYDPDFMKENNHFCYLGFRSGLQLSVNGSNPLTLVYGTDYTIDPDTLAVRLLNFAGGLGNPGDLTSFILTVPKDSRDINNMSLPTTMTFDFDIRTCNCSTPTSLVEGATTLANGTRIPSSFDYYVGTGVTEIKFTSTGTCEGFVGEKFSMYDASSSPLPTSVADFEDCQIQISKQQLCVYFDSQMGVLSLFSDSKQLTDPVTITYTLKTVSIGTDASGVLLISYTSETLIKVNIRSGVPFTSVPNAQKPVFMPKPDAILEASCNQTLNLPSLFSAQNSSITLTFNFRSGSKFMESKSDNAFFITSDCEAGYYLVQVTLTDSDNLSTSYQLAIHVSVPELKVITLEQTLIQNKMKDFFDNFEPPVRNKSTFWDQKQKPAWIQSISQTGLLEIQFLQPIYVPQFHKSQSRLLNSAPDSNLTLQSFIDQQVLSVHIQSIHGTNQVAWECKQLTPTLMQMQLHFSEPLKVSSMGIDTTVVTFLIPDVFISANKSSFTFNSIKEHTLSSQTPTQFKSKEQETLFTKVATVASQVSVTVVIITLIVQVIAKKVITQMLAYFFALQLIILTYTEANLQLPASASLFLQTVTGILNLSSVDKKGIQEKLHLAAGGVFDKLGGLSIAGIAGGCLIVFIAVAVRGVKHPKIKSLVQKMQLFFMWNFCIRYFQVTYINMQFTAVQQILTGPTILDKLSSYLILAFQSAILLLFVIVLLFRPLNILDLARTKAQIRNLYLNIDTRSRLKVAFGLLFFFQRTICVAVLARKVSFGIQAMLLQIVVVLYASYIFSVKPFLAQEDSVLDSVNAVILIGVQLIQLLLSDWVSDVGVRYNVGVAFDCYMVLCFFINAVLVILFSGPQVILRFKRVLYQRRHRRDEKMLDTFFDREEIIIQCHESLQLAHRKNFIKVLKERNPDVQFNQKTLNAKVNKLRPLQQPPPPLESVVESSEDGESDRSNVTGQSISNLEKYVCAIIDQKSQEAEDDEPWAPRDQQEIERRREQLTRDFHKAVDEQVSNEMLWKQIQQEASEKAELNSDLIISLFDAKKRQVEVQHQNSTSSVPDHPEIKHTQHLGRELNHTATDSREHARLYHKQLQSTETNQVRKVPTQHEQSHKQDQRNYIEAKTVPNAFFIKNKKVQPIQSNMQNPASKSVYEFFDFKSRNAQRSDQTFEQYLSGFFGESMTLEKMNARFVKEFVLILQQQNGQEPKQPKDMTQDYYQMILNDAWKQYYRQV